MRRVKRGADGVVSSAKSFAELTTPSAPFKGDFAASFLMSRPPLLFKGGKRVHYTKSEHVF